MSDTGMTDPLASLPAEVPEDVARNYAATLARAGISLEAVNRSLALRNAVPLAAHSRELAEAQRDALLRSDGFLKAYNASDPAAIAKLFELDLRVQASTGKLTDRDLTPAEYHLDVAQHMRGSDDKGVQTYTEDFQNIAAKLHLTQEGAKALVSDHFAVLTKTAVMSDDEKSIWSQDQEKLLHNAIGPDAEKNLAAASKALNEIGGGQLDLAQICRSNGCDVAINLYNHATAYKARK